MQRAAAVRKREELDLVRKADATLVVSPIEREILKSECPGLDVRVLPTIVELPDNAPTPHENRRNVVFIGGFAHAPNVDAVVYFVEEILPRVVKAMPSVVFQIVGSNVPARVRELSGPNVEVLGYVPQLGPILDRAVAAVAPLRYGAGVKGKVNQSMANGVPTVATSVAAEGMYLVHEDNAMIADNPAEFADAVVRLFNSRELWERISASGRQNVRSTSRSRRPRNESTSS